MTSKESIAYLKSHQPIGCRDKHTASLLQSYGVESYFSGCMTLTLGLKYQKKETNGKVYFVDPQVSLKKNKILKWLESSFYWLKHPLTCSKLFLNDNAFRDTSKKRRFLIVAKFINDYSKLFPMRLLKEAVYVSHQSIYYYNNFTTDEDRFEEAKRLVSEYSKASLVITSRIHCALPCLGIGTPVIYTALEGDSFISTSRMNGLIDLFNVIQCSEKGLKPMFNIQLPIDGKNHPSNKNDWKPLAKSLIERCKNFINK